MVVDILTNKQRNDIAEEIADFWKYNGCDDEFYTNCRDSVYEQVKYEYEVKEANIETEESIILKLIDEIYSKDNWKAIKLFNEQGINNEIIVQLNDVIINGLTIKNVWAIELADNIVTLYDTYDEIIGQIKFLNITDIEIGDNNDSNF